MAKANGKSKMNLDRVVPDTSVIIDGMLSKMLQKGELSTNAILVHEAVLAELEHQANQEKAKGYLGIEELKRLHELAEKYKFELQYSGMRPSPQTIKYASLGEIDAMIRQLAFENDADFLTGDKVQHRVAEARGIRSHYFAPESEQPKLRLESYFDEHTMSVHLRENMPPIAKIGRPGDWGFQNISKKKLTRDDIQDISTEIIETAGHMRDGFIEIERTGSTIVQLGRYRIVITKPPFSDGWEITAVRPVAKLSMEDYHLSEKLSKRIGEQAEGILIAGSPGMGKSTFAQALAEFYAAQGKIVKTIEAPRDMVLTDAVTQYAISHGSAEEVHDILLLSRPDYTIFDEMRNTKDFALYADLRLSGIGLAGVVHATNPIDAIQRFVGRIELGMIPQVVDTVIFIKNGKPEKVLSLHMTVKVPEGMTEEDLARPIVVVTDFESGESEYEMYSYGEETVVVPVSQVKKTGKAGHLQLAETSVENYFKKFDNNARAEMISEHKAVVYVRSDAISKIIGKGGSNISNIEQELGIGIDVKEISEYKHGASPGSSPDYRSKITKNNIVLQFDTDYANSRADLYLDGDYLLTASIGKDGKLKITTKNRVGKEISKAVQRGERIHVEIK